ncbi:MAG: diaminopimelate epimerase [Bacteroidetes bacterium]|nr:diaminopimelate epimerase [Bacteroidota bacterium]
MSTIHFTKYQGTGNDFIIINNFTGRHALSISQVKTLCDRRHGIGGDGLILIEKSQEADFFMNYFNSDGSKSFCGNGSRCAVHYAKGIGIIEDETKFEAIDGLHVALIGEKFISINMHAVSAIQRFNNDFVLNTGSPHYVHLSEDLTSEKILQFGKSIRFSSDFNEEGINVNLMKVIDQNTIEIATYERGVEDETLSCGTGAVACAIIFNELSAQEKERTVTVKVKGGSLRVLYSYSDGVYSDIQLSGPAIPIFCGSVEI